MSIGFVAPLHGSRALAQSIPAGTSFDAKAPSAHAPRDLQLEVFINGTSSELIAEFRQDADGSFAAAPDQLRNVGIVPAPAAMRPDGLVGIAQLPGVSFTYDESNQTIHFVVDYDALAARVIDARDVDEDSPAPKAQSSFGALANYTLFAGIGEDGITGPWAFEGVSGAFEGRLFSPFGIASSAYILSRSPSERYESTRLDTNWSYSSPATMTTYSIGDVISGGLSWTRPTRLGGIQIRRNFGLRPDLVTMPLPEFSGSAAVPSTVDVYVNNARRLSQRVPAGPFEVANLPVVTGSGTARVVVRDALGRETVSETPFFASSDLLTPGLWDYSAEAGFARRLFGVESSDYDGRFMGSGTVRFGLNDWLTFEGHGEGGSGLINAGGGAVFGLGPNGIGSFAASASSDDGRTGYQVAGGVELQGWDVHFHARTQRTFGTYNDIASVTAEPAPSFAPHFQGRSAAPLRALDQVSLSVPLAFDAAALAFSYTQVKTVDNDRSQILGLSVNRPIGRSTSLVATAFTDLQERGSSGLFVALSMPLAGDIFASTGVSSDSAGTTAAMDLVRSGSAEIGSIGWRLQGAEGGHKQRSASASYNARFARMEAGVEQFDARYRATAQVDGAVVLAGKGVFLSNRIDDAFAIVDAGAPGVDVQYENRPIGRTNRWGKLLITDLRSYEPNRITIDPTNLPVDAMVGGTREVAIPADRSGTVVNFDVETDARAALVTLRDEAGKFLETGARGRLDGNLESFVVGYDGEAYITGLGPRNRVTVDQPTRGRCAAEFRFEPRPGEQVSIPDAACRPIQ